MSTSPIQASPVQEVLLVSSTSRQKLDGVFSPPQRLRRSSRTSSAGPNKLTRLPPFSEVSREKHDDLLRSKLRQCLFRVDFEDPQANDEDKELKTLTLKELLDYISSDDISLSTASCSIFLKMFAFNCFRDLPHTPSAAMEEEENDFLEPTWPHLELVYELFLQLLEKPQLNLEVLMKQITKNFLMQLMDLLDSEDPRERDMVKQILHDFYEKFPALRGDMNTVMNNIFLRYIYENDQFNGICELLQVRSKFIGILSKPMKPNELIFFKKVLLPLHKPWGVVRYHQYLVSCIVHYVTHNESLFAVTLTDGILRFWPQMSPAKQVLFLSELETLMKTVSSKSLDSLAKRVFKCLANCVMSLHFQVTEKALLFFKDEIFIKLYKRNVKVALPILFPAVHQAKKHWYSKTKTSCASAFEALMAADPAAYKYFLGAFCQKHRSVEEEQKTNRRRVQDLLKLRKLTRSSERILDSSCTSMDENTSIE